MPLPMFNIISMCHHFCTPRLIDFSSNMSNFKLWEGPTLDVVEACWDVVEACWDVVLTKRDITAI